MKLVCVGVGPCRCLLLRHRKAHILLDCSLDSLAWLAATAAAGAHQRQEHKQEQGQELRQEDACAPEGGPRGGAGTGSSGAVLADLTPFLELLRLYDIQAALISTPEALLALPHLLAVAAGRPHPPQEQQQQQLRQQPERGGACDESHPHFEPAEPCNGLGAAVSSWDHAAAGDEGPLRDDDEDEGALGPIHGPVYATQAALDAAGLLMAERQATAAAAAGGRHACSGPLPGGDASGPLCGMQVQPDQRPLLGACWRPWHAPVTSHQVHGLGHRPRGRQAKGRARALAGAGRVLDAVRGVRYGEVVQLDGAGLTAVAYPAGSGYGHAVWVIMDGSVSIGYVASLSLEPCFAMPLVPATLAQLDCLVLAPGIARVPGGPPLPPPPQQQQQQQVAGSTLPPGQLGAGTAKGATGNGRQAALAAIREAALAALAGGGNVIIPVHASGVAWELIEALAAALASAGGSSSPASRARLAYVGPRAHASLVLATTSMEWLAPGRQQRVYAPQEPFAFDALMRAGRLVVGSSLRDPKLAHCMEGPLVALVAADSLAAGSGLELLTRWCGDPASALILPQEAPPAALDGIRALLAAAAAHAPAPPVPAPVPSSAAQQQRQPMRMRLLHLPLSSCGAQATSSLARLLAQLQPRSLVIHCHDSLALRQALLPGPLAAPAGPGAQPATPPARALPPLLPGSSCLVEYDWLQRVRVPLPRGGQMALVAPSLLEGLAWLSVGEQGDAQVARLQCQLVHRGGAWHLQALAAAAPAGGRTSTAGAWPPLQQAHLLLLRRPVVSGVLEALAARGVARVTVTSTSPSPEAQEMAAGGSGGGAPAAAAGQEQGVAGGTTCIRLDDHDAQLVLAPDHAHISADDPTVRQLLTDCLAEQLATL